MTQKYAGKCLCGATQYKVIGAPVIVAQCHCEECRRLSGTGHTIGAMFSKSGFSASGPAKEFIYQSSKDSTVTKGFCGQCGSPLYGTNTRTPEYITLSMGTLDDAVGLEVQVVIFEGRKQHWDQLGADVATFETQPDWTPQD